ncbi:MAG: tRNA epoxyqueuosine(34) reductase QueG [Gemmatimonadetes bacterium]|nr:tRNA epoxyqueuosine(34) reductase QueG [Gemmatimonadota bacterium]
MTTPAPQLQSADLKALAAELGFIACGITTLDPLPHADILDRWLREGLGGNMRYLNRQARKRKDPRLADRVATRAVVVLDNYYYPEQPTAEPPAAADRPKVARYARGRDYHQTTLTRLDRIAERLRAHGAATARTYTDTGPIAERELARRAGLGWIGKNTMLLRPGVGSWFFIGCVLTDLELEVDPPFATDHCGSCTRCLEACPTQAFIEPRLLDARRCISYLTIEQKGPIPGALAEQLSGWAFGCDICNEVCPWNERFAEPSHIEAFAPRPDLAGAGERFFEDMDQGEFDRRFGDTPLARPGLERMRRNWRAAWQALPRD